MTVTLTTLSSEMMLFLIGALAALQIITALYMIFSLRRASSQRAHINRDTFGLLKKVEGLLARRQEKLAKEYDSLLEQMTLQVPVTIAREAGKQIYETEKYVLTRLAELEPDLKDDSIAIQKMETIIKTMEELESSVIRATSRAVEGVLLDNRKGLLFDESNEESAAS